MICFIGNTLTPEVFREVAMRKGFPLTTSPSQADLIFISQDTPTDDKGNRDLEPIISLIKSIKRCKGIKVLTSQVPMGFTRSVGMDYYQAETLRINDAFSRALTPEMYIVGCNKPSKELPENYNDYLKAFQCPILKMTYEEAEFSKIAINMRLVSQVESTNNLYGYAQRNHVNWDVVKQVLQNDRRIGLYSYLDPGDWKKSKHLLRDWVTFNEGS